MGFARPSFDLRATAWMHRHPWADRLFSQGPAVTLGVTVLGGACAILPMASLVWMSRSGIEVGLLSGLVHLIVMAASVPICATAVVSTFEDSPSRHRKFRLAPNSAHGAFFRWLLGSLPRGMTLDEARRRAGEQAHRDAGLLFAFHAGAHDHEIPVSARRALARWADIVRGDHLPIPCDLPPPRVEDEAQYPQLLRVERDFLSSAQQVCHGRP